LQINGTTSLPLFQPKKPERNTSYSGLAIPTTPNHSKRPPTAPKLLLLDQPNQFFGTDFCADIAPVEQASGKVPFFLAELYDLLLDGAFGHQPVDRHRTLLADAMEATRRPMLNYEESMKDAQINDLWFQTSKCPFNLCLQQFHLSSWRCFFWPALVASSESCQVI
jgi:hypothetical protein